MVRRIVLGSGSIGHAVVEALEDRRGDLVVVEESENRVETLRNEGIAATRGDLADVGSIVDEADVVLVAGDDLGTNREAALAAREAFPACHLIVFVPGEGDVPPELEAAADRVIGVGRAVATDVRERLGGEDGRRLVALRRCLRGLEEPLGVFTHDDPDPDAIGSAIALVEIARSFGIEADAYFFGEIAHQENRALVNLLDLDLENLEAEEFDPDEFGSIALVDHSRPGVNDRLPTDTDVDLVIDHHPPRGPITAGLVDVQSNVGATSTLLAGYLDGFDMDPDPAVATALMYGIRVDTRDFSREITTEDFSAAAYLLPHARPDVLERVESPSVSGDTLDTIGRAIRDYRRDDSIVVSGVGTVSNRDAIAQAADQLLAMEGVTTTVVFGFIEDVVYLSGRTRGDDLDIGETMRQAFDQIGSAGGHSDMAGAQLPVGILGAVDREGSFEQVVGRVIVDRLFEVIGREPEFTDRDREVGLEGSGGPPG